MKEDYDITRQRQDDLIAAYKQVAPHCWSQWQAYERAVKLEAPRYYISPKQAAQVIGKMAVGDFSCVNKMRPIRKRMYYSLFDTVMRLSETREFAGSNVMGICRFAVIQPAPEFFCSARVLSVTRNDIKTGRIDDDGKHSRTAAQYRAYEKLKAKRLEERERKLRKQNSCNNK